MKLLLIVLGFLLVTKVYSYCSYTNIRTDIIGLGKNSSIYDHDCLYGDFICEKAFTKGIDIYNYGSYGKEYYTCNKNNKWESGSCNILSCHMVKDNFGCACVF